MRIILDTLAQQECPNPERIYFLQWHKIHVAPQYGTSCMVNFRWREFLCGIYTSVKFCNIWFKLFGIELKVNYGITIWLCLLNDVYFLYPNEHSTFTVCVTFFSTINFGWYYRLKSVRIETIWMEKCTEFYASIL